MSDLVPLVTHADRLRALEALPRTLELALEGRPFYGRLLAESWSGLVAFAWSPWRWLDA